MRRQLSSCSWILGLGLSALLASCSSSPNEQSALLTERHFRTSAPIREAYTRYFEVVADGEVVGHLLSYDELPVYDETERTLPAGSHRIQSLDFRDLGYVTITGDIRRFDGRGGSASLGQFELEPGLARFFAADQVKLRPLKPAVQEMPRAD